MKGSADGQLMKPEHVSIDSRNLYVVGRGNARIQVFKPISNSIQRDLSRNHTLATTSILKPLGIPVI